MEHVNVIKSSMAERLHERDGARQQIDIRESSQFKMNAFAENMFQSPSAFLDSTNGLALSAEKARESERANETERDT